MPPSTVILTILGYIAAVLLLSRLAARRGRGDFFALRSHRWWVVTFGMVSACMSGVSFVSVPGIVASSGFGYLQMCIGFFLGYLVIAFVLAPLYFRLGTVSIYGWLEGRFGLMARRCGGWLFFGAQLLRASMRLYLLCITQQLMVFDPLGLPFWLNVLLTVGALLGYTWGGGVRSVVASDMLRTVCMVAAIALSVVFIARALPGSLTDTVRGSGMTRVFFFDDGDSPNYFWKQLLGGFFIVIAMTGMDQEMMQRTLTCRSLSGAKRQLVLSSALQILVIAGFLLLGVLLYAYAAGASSLTGSSPTGDALFPTVATGGGLPLLVGVLFVLGLAAASYGAGGSALTALTTAFTVDILGARSAPKGTPCSGTPLSPGPSAPSLAPAPPSVSCVPAAQELVSAGPLPLPLSGGGQARCMEHPSSAPQLRIIHLAMAGAMAALVLVFRALWDRSVLDAIYTVAGYTYGPLLGLFAFGILTRRRLPGGQSMKKPDFMDSPAKTLEQSMKKPNYMDSPAETFEQSTEKPDSMDSLGAGYRTSRPAWIIPAALLAPPVICWLLSRYSAALFGGYQFGYELLPLNGALTFLLLLAISRKKAE